MAKKYKPRKLADLEGGWGGGLGGGGRWELGFFFACQFEHSYGPA